MADEIQTQGGAPAGTPVVVAPSDADTQRLTVPVSALELGGNPKEEIEAEAKRLRSDSTTVTVTEPAAPAATTPAAPAATTPANTTTQPATTPAATPAAAAPAATPVPDKIKVGGKEYTTAELEAALAARTQPAAAPAQPAAQPAAAAPAQPTPEEIAKRESDWCSHFLQESKVNFAPTADELETILSGGEEAVKLFGQKLTDLCAKTVLMARKSIYEDMNPVVQRLEQRLQPLVGQQNDLERHAIEHAFFAKYPDFKGHAETSRQIAATLIATYPDEVARMSREQFIDEVASQSDRILQGQFKSWNPAATGTWRDALKAGTAPAAAATTAATPATTPAAAPATAPAKPVVQAPAANSPVGQPAGSGQTNWHKDTAKSLAD